MIRPLSAGLDKLDDGISITSKANEVLGLLISVILAPRAKGLVINLEWKLVEESIC